MFHFDQHCYSRHSLLVTRSVSSSSFRVEIMAMMTMTIQTWNYHRCRFHRFCSFPPSQLWPWRFWWVEILLPRILKMLTNSNKSYFMRLDGLLRNFRFPRSESTSLIEWWREQIPHQRKFNRNSIVLSRVGRWIGWIILLYLRHLLLLWFDLRARSALNISKSGHKTGVTRNWLALTVWT